MNRITELQNEPKELEKLAAQRYLYSLAKRCLLFNLIISIPFIIIYFIISYFIPELNDYKLYVGVTISLFNLLLLNNYQDNRIKDAAIIQEQFDTYVMKLEWNPFLINKSINYELINKYNTRYLNKYGNHDKLKDWYEIDDSNIDIDFARIVCQRINIWWEKELRNFYIKSITIIPIIIFVVLLVLSLLDNTTLKHFINSIFYLSSILIFSIDQSKRNKKSCKTLEFLKNKIDFLVDESISNKYNSKELQINSRLLQDRIYFHRLNNALIFDYIYNKFRNKFQDSTSKGANDIINDYLLKRN